MKLNEVSTKAAAKARGDKFLEKLMGRLSQQFTAPTYSLVPAVGFFRKQAEAAWNGTCSGSCIAVKFFELTGMEEADGPDQELSNDDKAVLIKIMEETRRFLPKDNLLGLEPYIMQTTTGCRIALVTLGAAHEA